MKQKTYLPGKLCDRVRDLREEWGLTRKEIAERSGVDESLLGRIENNKNKKVSDEAVQALAKFFSFLAASLFSNKIKTGNVFFLKLK